MSNDQNSPEYIGVKGIAGTLTKLPPEVTDALGHNRPGLQVLAGLNCFPRNRPWGSNKKPPATNMVCSSISMFIMTHICVKIGESPFQRQFSFGAHFNQPQTGFVYCYSSYPVCSLGLPGTNPVASAGLLWCNRGPSAGSLPLPLQHREIFDVLTTEDDEVVDLHGHRLGNPCRRKTDPKALFWHWKPKGQPFMRDPPHCPPVLNSQRGHPVLHPLWSKSKYHLKMVVRGHKGLQVPS